MSHWVSHPKCLAKSPQNLFFILITMTTDDESLSVITSHRATRFEHLRPKSLKLKIRPSSDDSIQ